MSRTGFCGTWLTEQGGRPPSTDVADALLDERRELTE
jgi:hypothetical protein